MRWIAAALLALCSSALAAPEFLSADRTYYYRTDGDDVNTCLVDAGTTTPGYQAPHGACRYPQTAVNKLGDLSWNYPTKVTVQAGNESGVRTFGPHPDYSAAIIFHRPWAGSGSAFIRGDIANPQNVVLQTSDGSSAFHCRGRIGSTGSIPLNGTLYVEGFKLSAPGALQVQSSCQGMVVIGHIHFGETCTNGANCGHHFGVNYWGANMQTSGPLVIEGNAKSAVVADAGSIMISHPVDMVNSPRTFSEGSFYAFHGGYILSFPTWTGSVTGTPKLTVKSGAYIKSVVPPPGDLPPVVQLGHTHNYEYPGSH